MAFSIQFLTETEDSAHKIRPEEDEKAGRITLGDFRERFIASLIYWSTADYERQWREAVQRIVDGCEKSALITNMYDPAAAKFIVWWPMWRKGELVHVHNALLFMEQLDEPFRADDPYRHVGEHGPISDDGEAISDWVVTLDALARFLASSP